MHGRNSWVIIVARFGPSHSTPALVLIVRLLLYQCLIFCMLLVVGLYEGQNAAMYL